MTCIMLIKKVLSVQPKEHFVTTNIPGLRWRLDLEGRGGLEEIDHTDVADS